MGLSEMSGPCGQVGALGRAFRTIPDPKRAVFLHFMLKPCVPGGELAELFLAIGKRADIWQKVFENVESMAGFSNLITFDVFEKFGRLTSSLRDPLS